jgi:hypothetical protein
MFANKKAVSTFIMIILILCSIVLGALLSYLWVMGNFYVEPENTSLTITQVNFPVDHADYFNITVVNPSHSPTDTNITQIYFIAEGNTETHQVTSTSPETLPITLVRGTEKTIKCIESWSEFAGKNITVYVSASSASGSVASFATSLVKLSLQIKFDASISCRNFNVTIANDAASAINLTLTKLLVNLEPIETATRLADSQNVTIYGMNLPKTGESLSLNCLFDWENLNNPRVRIETAEGYYAEATANATATVLLSIINVAFNETNPNNMNITVENAAVSRTAVDLTDIALTYLNGTTNQEYHIDGNHTNPTFAPYYHLGIGKNVTFNNCLWNWANFRDQNVTITIHTRQEYTPVSTRVRTPKAIVFKISSDFDLADVGYFLVNVKNMGCSLQNITVTQIKLNTNQTIFTPQEIPIGESGQLNCTFDWTAFRGIEVTITVNASNVIVTQKVTLPYMQLNIISAHFATSVNGKEFNVTIENINNSSLNATVVRVIVRFGNETVFQGQSVGYLVEIGHSVTLAFSWDWSQYASKDVTISVYTVQGLEFSNTFTV